ncbi:MAG: hypothetical protein ACLTV3_13050, partial [Faecalibacterium prausnitzii]
IRNTPPYLWPARSASHLTERKTSPAPQAREPAQRKKRLCLWPARSAKLLDQKKKPAPRHKRENQLKEKTSSASGPRGAQSHLTERIKPAPRHRRARQQYTFLMNAIFENCDKLL